MIRPWLKHAALEPNELRGLQAAFDGLKAELKMSAEDELHVLAYDLMTAFERHYPDCAKAADAVRQDYCART